MNRRQRVSALAALLLSGLPVLAQSDQAIAALGAAIRQRGDSNAVRELDQLAAGNGPLASRARQVQKQIIATAYDRLEDLAAMEPGLLQALAAAEVSRLRGREAKWRIADVRRIEAWHKANITKLEKAIEQDKKRHREKPDRIYVWRIEATTKQLQQLRPLSIRAAGVRLLGEFYEATQQTSAAVRAVMMHRDLAEAAKNLPSLRVEVQSGRVDRSGEMMVESTEEHEIDVAKWASAFFNMASAQSSLDAKRSRELAAENRGVLERLSSETLAALKLGYAERVSAETKAAAKRKEEIRRRNQRRKR